ncbi:hypothetical protein [Saccharicrinis sp. FJH54]|uniref:hypothetical protein n=1 Tax=Saccharicrinis sp. FJH54 TaxID=3344665 RepID=UPI0035D4502C
MIVEQIAYPFGGGKSSSLVVLLLIAGVVLTVLYKDEIMNFINALTPGSNDTN